MPVALRPQTLDCADAAVVEERRRIARALHDGLAQELAYLAAQSQRLRATPDELAALGAASRRALDETRRLIDDLNRPTNHEGTCEAMPP